jgi:thioredoxin 1
MQNLTSESFAQFTSAPAVLVDFWATWCGPCQMQGKVLEKVASEHPELADKIGKVNVDDERELAVRFGINAIPALLFFRDGKLAKNMVGLHSEADILALFQN